jgi:ATP-dependent DNA helicase DinG
LAIEALLLVSRPDLGSIVCRFSDTIAGAFTLPMSVTPVPNDIPPPVAPVLVLGQSEAVWLSEDGEFEHLPLGIVAARIAREAKAGGAPPMLVHRAAVARRLGLSNLDAADVLERFAVVHPARPCLPTPRGLAEAVG